MVQSQTGNSTNILQLRRSTDIPDLEIDKTPCYYPLALCMPKTADWLLFDSSSSKLSASDFRIAQAIIDLATTTGEVLSAPDDNFNLHSVLVSYGFNNYDQFRTTMFNLPLVGATEVKHRIHNAH